jgi:hypothetical protein
MSSRKYCRCRNENNDGNKLSQPLPLLSSILTFEAREHFVDMNWPSETKSNPSCNLMSKSTQQRGFKRTARHRALT